MWTDSLTLEQVMGTLRAADLLVSVSWGTPLLARVQPLIERLRTGVTDREAYRKCPLEVADQSFLFEVRFAAELVRAGLEAEYEHKTGVGNSSVDFLVKLDPPWFVELVSLHETDAFKAASWNADDHFGFMLRSDANDEHQSIEGEILKAQERIGEKVFDRKRGKPIKFPQPNGSVHLIFVDARSLRPDKFFSEWLQLSNGPSQVEEGLVYRWPPKGGHPIRGLFEHACPLRATSTLRERIHFLGLSCERSFTPGEITNESLYVPNPALLPNNGVARSLFAGWPLHPSAAPERD